MLFYLFFYLVTMLLLLQGIHLIGEQRRPMGVVPEELALPRGAGQTWGGILALVGIIGAVCGLVSHGESPWVSRHTLTYVQCAEWILMGIYGLWLIFLARRVRFAGVSAASAENGQH